MTQWFDGNSIEHIYNKIKLQVQVAVDRALRGMSIELEQMFKERTQAWYSIYTPDPTSGGYNRTWDLLNSITIKDIRVVRGVYRAEVFFDPSKVRRNYAERQHMFNDMNAFFWVIEQGWDQNMRGGEGADILSSMIKELENGKLQEMFMRHMAGSGVQVYVISSRRGGK